MKKVLIFFLLPASVYLVCCAMGMQSDNINWDDVTNFRLYEFRFNKPLGKLSELEIEKMRYIETDIQETRGLMKNAKRKDYEMFLWKGKHLAIIEFKDGQKRRILISNYAGVLLDFDHKQFYQFEGGSREEWENFMQKYKEKLYKSFHE